MYSPEIEALYALIAELLPDSVTGEITPARARQVLGGLLDYVGNLNTNQVKGSVFRVPFVVNVAGLATVPTVLIPARSRILGMDVRAINGTDAASAAAGVRAEPIDFRLIAYPTGTIDALVDEQATTTTTIKARWVRTSGSDEQKRAYFDELIPEDHNYLKGEVVYYVFPNGATRLLQWRANSAGFTHPVPTGEDDDPIYAPFALAAAVAGGVSQQYVDDANAEQQVAIDALESDIVDAENEIAALESRVDVVEVSTATNAAAIITTRGWIGSLTSLATTAKNSIVAAINELKAGLNAAITSIPAVATPAEIAAAANNTKYTTPAGLYAGGIRAGSDFFVGEWNPNRNRIAPDNYAIVTSENTKGSVYRIAETATPFTTTISLATDNDIYISVYSSVGIGFGHIVTGPGIPPGTAVGNSPTGSTVILSNQVTLPSGTTLTFTPKISNLTVFTAGDWLVNLGGGVWAIRPGSGSASSTFGVSGAKRQAVAYTNQPQLTETDAAYQGLEFYDEVTFPGRFYHFRCAPLVQADNFTVLRWVRREITL